MANPKRDICCIFNLAPHYREAIFKQMDAELHCDFYFGDRVETFIQTMNYKELRGFKKIVKNIFVYKFIWQRGIIALPFKRYKHFVLTGDVGILSSWVLLILCKFLNKRVYLWMHGIKGPLSWKSKLMTYPFYWMAHKYFLYNDFSRRLMIDSGFSENKIVCVYNSLDYDKQLSIRKKQVATDIYQKFFGNHFPVLIYIGRIQQSKKLNIILDAMLILREKDITCNLVIVGEDIEEVRLEEDISKKDLRGNTWLYGSCYEEEQIAELIYNADVCVSPGNVGLTAMHCFTYGTPVITHNNFSNQNPEFEVVTPSITGDFFEENNAIDLSSKIENWINLNPDRRTEVRNLAYAVIEDKYNPHYQIKVLKKVFNLS
jgi:glycosyltransferase involved in cell wall biosynthesis